jgi:pimeloyl-ACP methyl ester carboxylesterase
MAIRPSVVFACLALMVQTPAVAGPDPAGHAARWERLPPTPALPQPAASGHAAVNGISLYYATFGQGAPVILLHGGLANSNYWGGQVPALARDHRVVVVDSRGHGRSTRSDQPYSYELMASDVVALMDHLKIDKAAVVGWSDGAIIGLVLAIHHPDRLTGVFAFAANYNPAGLREDLDKNPTFNAFIERCSQEYEQLSSTPKEYKDFLAAIEKMWATEPNLTKDDLRAIRVPMVIADGDRDEAIRRDHTEEMAALIPGAGLLIQPNVSHFSMLQDAEQFTTDVLQFLAQH